MTNLEEMRRKAIEWHRRAESLRAEFAALNDEYAKSLGDAAELADHPDPGEVQRSVRQGMEGCAELALRISLAARVQRDLIAKVAVRSEDAARRSKVHLTYTVK